MFFPPLFPHMSRPRRDPPVKREVVVKEEEVDEEESDDGGESEGAAVVDDDPVGVYEAEYVMPSKRPVRGRWCQ